jgi:eukaryotic-like serine/threonine-protein kinase
MRLEQTTLPVGTLLYGRYLLKNVLGAGNSGTVYLVKDQQAEDPQRELFALKEMLRLDPQERQQIALNEGVLRALRHPALPSIYTVFNDNTNERTYLLMDYVEGVDLGTLCQEQPGGYFAWFSLQGALAPVFEALTYLHNQDRPVFHGDIKPLNLIRLASAEYVVLVDLGYAQAVVVDPRKQFNSTALSSYRAPEHLGGHIDAATDIYEMGATLYLLLTGQPPVDATTRLKQIKKGEPDPLLPASHFVAMPRAFAEVLQCALALEPGQRYFSIQAFGLALDVAARATPVPMSATEPVPFAHNVTEGTWPDARVGHELQAASPSQQPAARRSFLPVFAIFAVLLLVALGFSGWWLSQKHTNTASVTLPVHLTPAIRHDVTPTGQAGGYPNVAGVYLGTLNSLSAPTRNFSLTIQQQQGSLSGTFSSSAQNGTFIGTIDLAGNIQFVVLNAAGNAIYAFSGGLNGTSQIADSGGGTFYSCEPVPGANCQQGPGPSGTWSLNQSTGSLPINPASGVAEIARAFQLYAS